MGIESELHRQHLDRARHLRGDAARAHRRLCALRQWRLPAATSHFIRRVTTADGEVLYENTGGGNPRVVATRNRRHDERHDDRHGRDRHGEEGRLSPGRPPARPAPARNRATPGSSATPANLTTGVWFGNDDGAPMKKVTGGALPAEAWHEFMVAAHEGVPVAALPGTWKAGRGGPRRLLPSARNRRRPSRRRACPP